MSEEDKDKINKEEEIKIDENQSQGEHTPNEPTSSDETEKMVLDLLVHAHKNHRCRM